MGCVKILLGLVRVVHEKCSADYYGQDGKYIGKPSGSVHRRVCKNLVGIFPGVLPLVGVEYAAEYGHLNVIPYLLTLFFC